MIDQAASPAAWTIVESPHDGQQRATQLLLSGELDIAVAPQLVMTLDTLVAAGCRQLNVHLDTVTFTDAAILGALVATHNRMAADGGALVVTCPGGQPRRLLRLTGLEHLLAPADLP